MSATQAKALTHLSATELAGRIARGELTAQEAVEVHIARIEAVNPALNAVVVPRFDEARAEARAADERQARGEPLGPLHGVPITIKEAFAVAGTPATYGLRSRAHTLAADDDSYVARLRAAGAIVLGKTNVPQVLLYNETDNPVYGRTNNPWDLARTPGGSSGGEAAILAAGGSALGLGSDIAGSLRVPAAYCGICSIRPTAGRLPDFSDFGMSPGQTAISSQAGPMARTVDDVALALGILNGGTNPAAEPPRPLGDPAAMDLAALRVAYFTDDGILPVAPAVRRAVTEAAGMLAGRGAQVTEWQPPSMQQAADLLFGIFSADGARRLRRFMGRDPKDPRIAQTVLLASLPRPAIVALGGLLAAAGQRQQRAIVRCFGRRDTDHFWQLVAAQQAYRHDFAAALDAGDGGPFDLVVCPAHALPALPHGASKNLITAGAYAIVVNVLGYPAGIVPVTRVRQGEESDRKGSADVVLRAARAAERGTAGLPVGVQVLARPWREHVALAAMRAIEASALASGEHPGMPTI
ncbi:MAG TPA: amidase family protein [Ktedonobacterales bacterium]